MKLKHRIPEIYKNLAKCGAEKAEEENKRLINGDES